jgi:hypothetical protein
MTTVEDWTERLARAAISERDRRAITASESAREMVLERLESSVEDHDALHAWAVLGRVLADESASPSLVAEVVDALVDARRRVADSDDARRRVADSDASAPKARDGWAPSARAAIVEAFVAAQLEIEAERVKDAWRFPRCVVPLDESTAAVAASFPDEDSDALARWADEVASGLAKMGIRRVHAEGTPRSRAALADALSVAGIDLAPQSRRASR